MVALRKNWMMTVAGIMVAIGQIPLGLQYAHLPFALPLWWNACQFPMWLIGTVGGTIVGVAGKGQDEHSTLAQTEAATTKAVADHIVTATDAQPAEMPAVPVVIVKPQDVPKP